MKKFITIVLSIVLAGTLLTGCGNASENDTSGESGNGSSSSTVEEASTITVTDSSGAEVTLPSNIEKVVATNPSAVAFMTAMGLDDKLVGTHGSILNHSWVRFFMKGSVIWRYSERIQMRRS